MRNKSMDYLIRNGVIPNDSTLIQHRHNLITKSIKSNSVSRISAANEGEYDTTPQNVEYSHHVAWEAGAQNQSILQPILENPIRYNKFVISQYPLGNIPQYDDLSYSDLSSVLKRLSYINTSSIDGLRALDVYSYASERLLTASTNTSGLRSDLNSVIDYVKRFFYTHQDKFFDYINESPRQLIHGDIHSQNIIYYQGDIRLIDLDTASEGPPLYDIASWHLRYLVGDDTMIDVNQLIEIAAQEPEWDKKMYKAMIGWKAISSMTYLLVNGERFDDFTHRIKQIGEIASNICGINIERVYFDYEE